MKILRNLANLERREGFLLVDPEEIIEMDWTGEWQPFLPETEEDIHDLRLSGHHAGN